jgi:hypothetical protein
MSNDPSVNIVLVGYFLIFASLLAGGVVLYFIPSIIGYKRQIENTSLLLLANILIGWTMVGWLACLLWSCLATSYEIATVETPGTVYTTVRKVRVEPRF